MKTHLLFLIFLAVGCQEPGPVVANPVVELPKAERPIPEPPAQKQDSRYKAERIHQLKDLETRKIVVGGRTITVWIMDDASKRAEGMMWLVDKDVKDTEGMLFLFSDSQPRSFWMQNCPLGLDITYIDSKGKVLNTGIGKPFDESGVPSKGSAQYVLELKVGRAKKFGIKPGSVLRLPKDVKSKD
ncbi:MAG: DUF192 domain-containing protein [Chlorobia bacterium]|nr:DUF192 domain-containing protein [Fimbriimonadaceae bacterium]